MVHTFLQFVFTASDNGYFSVSNAEVLTCALSNLD